MKRITPLFILLPLLLIACEGNISESTEDPIWELEEQIYNKGESLKVKEINQAIEKAMSMRLSWSYSPLTIALKVAGQQMVSPNVKIVAKSLTGNELITEAVVMIVKNNLPDDSIENEYYRVELKLGGSIWQVVDAKKAFSCRSGRGHEDISAKICQ